MHSDYRYSAIRDLRDEQLRFASRERRLAAIRRAEDLLIDADAATEYPCVEVHRALTCQVPQTHLDDWISGQDLRHDLQLLVDDLSDAIAVSAEAAGQRVLTVAELAKELNVSAKTISRWRRLGLVSRRFLFAGRKRLGFLQSSVNRFVARNRIRVLRGSQFSQLTEQEREAIIRRGRAMAQAGHCPAAVTRQLAQEAGRTRRPFATPCGISTRPIRTRPFSPVIMPPCGTRPSGRSTNSTGAASRPSRWRSDSTGPGRESGGSWPRCGPAASASCRLVTSPTSSLPWFTARRRRGRSCGQCPAAASRPASFVPPLTCRPTWPASTRCRC